MGCGSISYFRKRPLEIQSCNCWHVIHITLLNCINDIFYRTFLLTSYILLVGVSCVRNVFSFDIEQRSLELVKACGAKGAAVNWLRHAGCQHNGSQIVIGWF